MANVIVVGGGVIGLCVAYYAARQGHQVVVVDSRRSGDSCAVGCAGMITPSHFVPLAAPGMVSMGLRMMWNRQSPFYIRPRWSAGLASWGYRFWRHSNAAHVQRSSPVLRDLNLESRNEFDKFSQDGLADFDWVKRGLLMLCRTEHGLHEEGQTAHHAAELGIPAEVLTADEIARREPGVQMKVTGGVFYPLDCHLSPDRFVEILEERLKQLGVTIHLDTRIEGWRREGGRIRAAHTSRGEMEADEFVLAAGSWSSDLASQLGLRIPMQPGKGYSLTLPEPKVEMKHCAILTEARVAVTPMGERLRFGGTMELSGHDASVNPHRVQGIINSVLQYYPQFTRSDFDQLPVWFGFRPCSPDGLPYLGRYARFKNLIVASGHAMMGLSLGPVTGRLVAEILGGEEPSLDISLLNPNRYA